MPVTRKTTPTRVKNKGLVAAAAAIPIALTVASNTSGPPTSPTELQAVTCPASVKSIKDCHPAFPVGCSDSKSPNYDAYLNFMKNKIPGPALLKNPANMDESDFDDLNKNTPASLTPGNHAELADKLKELGEGQVRSVVAYLYFAKTNPGESSNCQLPNVDDGDFHVLIGFDAELAKKVKGLSTIPKDLKKQVDQAAVIVEMTPTVRQQSHPNWSVPLLKKHWGDQVKVVGQLMVDNEHNIASNNCALPGHTDACWRSTVWEIHPVMEFYVCGSGTCSADSDAGWVALDNAK